MIYLGVATSIIVVLAEMFLGRGSIVGLHREALTSLTVEIAGGQGELLELKNCILEIGFHIRSFEFSQKEKGTLKANIVLGVPQTEAYYGASGIEAAVDYWFGSEGKTSSLKQ